MSTSQDLRALIHQPDAGALEQDTYEALHWEGTFDDYLDVVAANPRVARNSYQRLYELILHFGYEESSDGKETLRHYRFFEDPLGGGRDAVFGLTRPLMNLVAHIKSAAYSYGVERRVLLLHGPVGSAKSTIVRLMKRGLEWYSRTPDGALYSYAWKLPNGELAPCPMFQDPLCLLPVSARRRILGEVTKDVDLVYSLRIDGDADPFCQYYLSQFLAEAKGDIEKVLDHVVVQRVLVSEKDRRGIGTFQPKDEKNQDSTELTGDINYRKIAMFGSDSDPRAFNFDGEFNVANRGLIEFVEVLKLDVAFLYDLLGASQEHMIKPKKFPQTHIDEVIVGHTNEPEFRRLQNNELMEAFRDRTIRVDVPYNTVLDDEIRIYQKDYNAERVSGKHIAPHTIAMGSMWAVLTRLEEPKNANLTLLQKLKLYNGKTLPGFTQDNIRELKEESPREGMNGISPRYIQDKISNALVEETGEPCVNPFMVMNELEEGLGYHSLITSNEQRKRFQELLAVVKEEYEDIVKNEVQRAIAADEEAVARLCGNYLDNLKAYTQGEKVRNKYTGKDEEPDERLMRSIEEKIGIPDSRKDDFRREIMNYIGALAMEGKSFTWKSNERLQKALELKLFEDQKDTIKLTSLVSAVVDKDTQEKIDVVKTRLIKNLGYCDVCATDVLNFVASIFARGDAKETYGVVHRIDRDRARFREIIRGKIRKNLRKFISQGEMFGRKGRNIVSIPLPGIRLPRFQFGDNRKQGVGQGEGEGLGEDGEGQAGEAEGHHVLEVEVTLEEMAEILGEELGLPRIEPKGKDEIAAPTGQYTGIRRAGPESLRHIKRTLKAALRRQVIAGTYDPDDPILVPNRSDRRYRSWKETEQPQNNAVVIYMMDVSGSMGKEQKEIVRVEAFWLNTWLKSQYRNLTVRYIVHDAVAREVDEHTFFHLRESGGTKISSAYELCAHLIEERFPPSDWNIYPFHFSDGDNWSGRDTERCLGLMEEQLLPSCNVFCYGQVKSAYGSGQFKKDLDRKFGEDERVITSDILDRESILDSIRDFLGTGR